MALHQNPCCLDVYTISAEELFSKRMKSWDEQQFIDPQIMKLIKAEQKKMIKKFGLAVIPGNVIAVRVNGEVYIASGHYQYSLIQYLMSTKYRTHMRYCRIGFEIYECFGNKDLASKICDMCII